MFKYRKNVASKKLDDERTYIVYRFILECEKLMDEEIHNMMVLNREIQNILPWLEKLKFILAGQGYETTFKEAIKIYFSLVDKKPRANTIELISDIDQFNVFLIEIINNQADSYIKYWDKVLADYKLKSARVKRIKYLIGHLDMIDSYTELSRSTASLAILGQYKERLEKELLITAK